MGNRLGQHFLRDGIALKKIIEALELSDDDFVIEIGPGHGELTDELGGGHKAVRIIGIEKDKELAGQLKEKYGEHTDKNKDKIEIIEGDALKILPLLILNSPFLLQGYKIVGNIPYYITGYLLRTLGELEHKPKLIVLTVQKEVAGRLCARPPRMNLLAASVQWWAGTKVVGVINKSNFKPPPKVDSAIIKLIPKPRALDPVPYYRFIKALFKQPKKTILNNIAAGYGKSKGEVEQKLNKHNFGPQLRPHNLSVEEIVQLSSVFQE